LAQKGWKEITAAGLIADPGNSVGYETGAWRAFRPIIDFGKCTHCMLCWIYCPDGAVMVENSKVVGIDLKHCKGCGICATECPRKVIIMVEEAKAQQGVI
jgi:pyruvate ferredoxin oxidoreductase delta subunit